MLNNIDVLVLSGVTVTDLTVIVRILRQEKRIVMLWDWDCIIWDCNCSAKKKVKFKSVVKRYKIF